MPLLVLVGAIELLQKSGHRINRYYAVSNQSTYMLCSSIYDSILCIHRRTLYIIMIIIPC